MANGRKAIIDGRPPGHMTLAAPHRDSRVSSPVSQWRLLQEDIVESVRLWRLWTHLAWSDVLKQYRRSFLGPVWISLNTSIFIVIFGLIGAQLFNAPLEFYLAYFCTGHVFFSFFSSMINEGCQAYIASEAFLKQTPIPKMTFVLRVAWRNLIMLAHNFVVVIGVLWWAQLLPRVLLNWFLLGLLLTVSAGVMAIALLGAVAARFRDIPMIMSNIMQIAFFVTPVMWQPHQLTERAQVAVLWNPLAAYLDLLRMPMLGKAPADASLQLAAITLGMLVLLYLALYRNVRRRIVYWL